MRSVFWFTVLFANGALAVYQECVAEGGWKQTSNCDGLGVEEPSNDLPCASSVPQGASGYCACGPAGHTSKKPATGLSCGHTTFTCDEVCHEEKTPTMLPKPDECVMFRNTQNCDPTGQDLFPSGDKPCDALIPMGMSGFCECGDYEHNGEYLHKTTHYTGCTSAAFHCRDMCSSAQNHTDIPITPKDPTKQASCSGWRQTAGCSEHGVNEHDHDLTCQQEVPMGASGYCECTHMVENVATPVAFNKGGVGCGHDDFNCSSVCDGSDLPGMLPQTCVAWRATNGCDATGGDTQRTPANDGACDMPVATGLSGYCDCGWAPTPTPGEWAPVKVKLVGCETRPSFDCATECAAAQGVTVTNVPTSAPISSTATTAAPIAALTNAPTAAPTSNSDPHVPSPTCTAWRETNGCDSTGTNVLPANDGGCDKIINAGESGFCQCGWLQDVGGIWYEDKRGQDSLTHAANNQGFGCDAPSYLREGFTCANVCLGVMPTFGTAVPSAAPTSTVITPTMHVTMPPTETPDLANRPRAEATVLLSHITPADFFEGGAPWTQFITLFSGHMSVSPNSVIVMTMVEQRRRQRRRLLAGSTQVTFAVLGNSFLSSNHVISILDAYLNDPSAYGFGAQYKVALAGTINEDVTVTVLQRAHAPGAQADVPAAPVAWDPTMTVLFVLLGALVCCTCGVVVVVFVVKKIKSGKGKTKGYRMNEFNDGGMGGGISMSSKY